MSQGILLARSLHTAARNSSLLPPPLLGQSPGEDERQDGRKALSSREKSRARSPEYFPSLAGELDLKANIKTLRKRGSPRDQITRGITRGPIPCK